MINLLSVEYKKNLNAARFNVVLRRYVISLVLAIIFMLVAFAVGYWFSLQSKNAALADKAENEQRIAQYADVKQRAEAFETNLKSAKTILEKEVTYSNLLVAIAKSLPEGAVLTTANISTEQVGGEPIAINARTVDAGSTPLMLKSALEKSPLFEDVNISTITKDSPEAEKTPFTSRYPVTVSLMATITPEGLEAEE